MDQVEEVKQKTDIVSVISEHVNLKKAGRNYKGLCPFHGEKTPSFMVSPELQIYKCFGCGESGDVISFLEKQEGLEFFEALKLLADKAGVKLIDRSGFGVSEKEKIIKINELASKVYSYILLNHKAGAKALSYLTEKRGLKMDTIKKFSLGFSPDNPKILDSYFLGKKGYKKDELTNSGIFYLRSGKIMDRFQGRIIFPLFDHRGDVIGFSGRLMPESKSQMGKYINSPETPAYHKSRTLYGLNFTKGDIKKEGFVVLTEGELDMISCFQAGFKNVVAIKGTAFTQEQAELLSRFTQVLVLALDSDAAGDLAVRRSVEIAEKIGLDVKVIETKKYKDPDEMVRQNPQGFKKLLSNPKNIWDFFLDSVFAKYNAKEGLGKSKISKELIPILAKIDDSIVQAHYAKKLADKLGVPETAVLSEISKKYIPQEEKSEEEKVKPQDGRRIWEKSLISIGLRSNPKLLAKKDVEDLISDSLYKKILAEFKKVYQPDREFVLSDFSRKIPKELLDGLSEIVLDDSLREHDDEEKSQKEFNYLKNRIIKEDIKKQREDISKELKEAEKISDDKRIQKLQESYALLNQKYKTIEEN